jgi:HEAT repeat protein
MRSRDKAFVVSVTLGLGAVAVLVALLLFVGPRESPPEGGTPVPGEGTEKNGKPSLPKPVGSGEEKVRPLEDALKELEGTDDPRSVAVEMRKRAASDREYLLKLIALLSDESVPMRTREIIALVLGSLRDARARDALIAALRAGGTSAWIETLILALGLSKEETSFDHSVGDPFIVKHSSGLILYLWDPGLAEAAVDAVVPFLDHDEKALRYAAWRSLQPVIRMTAASPPMEKPTEVMEKVRKPFLEALRREQVETMRAQYADTLAEWAKFFPASLPEQQQTVAVLIDVALEDEAKTVRFLTKDALWDTNLPAAEWKRLVGAAFEEDFDTRTWATEVVAHQVGMVRKQDADQVWDIFAEGLEDPNPKIREFAARDLSWAKLSGGEKLLLRGLEDAEWNVRNASAQALRQYPATEEVVAALEKVSREDPNGHVRETAAECLKWFEKRPK